LSSNDRVMAQAVRRQPFTAEAQVVPGQSSWDLRWKKVKIGQVCLPVLLFPPFSIIPPMVHTHLHLIPVFSAEIWKVSNKAMLYGYLTAWPTVTLARPHITAVLLSNEMQPHFLSHLK